ncbi:MAG: type II toxin-antitoxin system RelE/ParE family toxin [Nanoarchaeota archaeon]
MTYHIEWKENALRNLRKIEISIVRRVIKNVEEMQEDPFSKDVKKLRGCQEYRLRVGDYRIIFSLEKDIITILKVGHRQQVYEQF